MGEREEIDVCVSSSSARRGKKREMRDKKPCSCMESRFSDEGASQVCPLSGETERRMALFFLDEKPAIIVGLFEAQESVRDDWLRVFQKVTTSLRAFGIEALDTSQRTLQRSEVDRGLSKWGK